MKFLFRFSGRIDRLQWNLGQILVFALTVLPMMTMIEIREGTVHYRMPEYHMLGILALSIWINIAISIQRLHDRDRSGFWLVPMLLIPGGFIWMIVELGFLPGTPGPNRFGPPPGGSIASLSGRFRFRTQKPVGNTEHAGFDPRSRERTIAELKASRAQTMHHAEQERDAREKRSAFSERAGTFEGERAAFERSS